MENKNFILLVVGAQATTYQLNCELVTEENHNIKNGEHLYEYLSGGDNKIYHISDFDTEIFD